MKLNFTIEQYLETLPEPYRTQALNNTKKYRFPIISDYSSDVREAVDLGIRWDQTPEGDEYWWKFYEQLCEPNYKIDQIVHNEKSKCPILNFKVK